MPMPNETEHTGPRPKRQRGTARIDDEQVVDRYAREFTPHHTRVTTRGWRGIYRTGEHHWSRGFVVKVLKSGNTGMSFVGSSNGRFLVIDVDNHREGLEDHPDAVDVPMRWESARKRDEISAERMARVPDGASLDEFVDAVRVTRREARRRVVAERYADLVAWLLRVFPYARVEESDRGLHVVVPLAYWYEAAELVAARAAVERLLAAADVDGAADCEVFPKPTGKRLRHCRHPLSGRRRLLAADLVSDLHGRRGDDFRELVDGIKAELEIVVEDAERELARLEREQARYRAARRVAPVEWRPGGRPVPVEFPAEEVPEPQPRRVHDDSNHRVTCASAVRRGEEFVLVVEGYARSIPAGQSYDATQKLAYVFANDHRGWSEERAMLGFRAIVDRAGHGAAHCQTPVGVEAMLRTFRNRFRLYRSAGKALVRNPRLLRVVDAALGMPLTPLRKPQDASAGKPAAYGYRRRADAARRGHEARRAGTVAAAREERAWVESFFERAGVAA